MSPTSTKGVHLIGCAALFSLIAFATAGAQNSDETPKQSPSVEITWTGGDVLQGRLLSMNSSSVVVQTQLFREPVELVRQKIEAIRFASPFVESKVAAYSLVTLDGSQFNGEVLSTTQDAITLRDVHFGELEFSRSEIANFEPARQILYVWNGKASDWQTIGVGLTGNWTLQNGSALSTNEPDARTWLRTQFKDSFAIDFTVQAENALDFLIATSIDSDKGFRFGKIGDSWILGSAKDFEIVDSIPTDSKQLELQLTWDANAKKLSLLQNRKVLISTEDPSNTSRRSGILLVNQGKSLALTSLKVSSLTPVPNGDSANLEPIDRPSNLPTPGQLDRVQFEDGSVVWGTFQELRDGTATILMSKSERLLNCAFDSIRLINPKTEGQHQNLKDSHHIQYGESRLSGHFELKPVSREVVWHSACLGNEAILDQHLNLTIKVIARNAISPLPIASFSNVLYLENGDCLPCKLVRGNETATWLLTPFATETAMTSNAELRAVELQSASKEKPAFTNESREMLLSIPCNQEIDSYSHALVGKNGDLLRGNMVSINDKSIEVDSKFQPMVVDREQVAALIFMRPMKDTPGKLVESNTNASDKLVQIELLGGYTLKGNWVGGTAETIELQSSALGLCKVPVIHVVEIEFNPRSTKLISNYFSWNTKNLLAPRWKASVDAVGKSANELIGSQVPELTLANLNGESFQLSQHAGQVVVLDFWATWCGPCIASLPKYLDMLNEFPDTEVAFYGVNSSESPDIVRDFLAKKNWSRFNTLFDYDGAAAKSLRVQGIPHTMIIGRDGKIAHVQVGYAVGAADKMREVIGGLLK